MKETNKCLKEWNATIEALGHGKQTILIRTYGTNLKEFLLYPSVSYVSKNNYLESFQKQYQSFVEEYAIPKKDSAKTEIKYFAKVEKVIERSPKRIGSLHNHYIWTKEHVISYLNNQKAKIWILRVYELEKPYMAEPTPGAIRYANLQNKVNLDKMKPIINDNNFLEMTEKIIN